MSPFISGMPCILGDIKYCFSHINLMGIVRIYR